MVSEKSKPPFPARLVISIAGVLLLLVYTIYSNTNSLLIADQTSGCRRGSHQETIDYVKNHSGSGPRLGQQQQQHRTSKLGDDCYHIFLDVGANMGVHSRFLMEPDSYPIAKTARGHFDSIYGTQRDNRDFCMFAFEPNPAHKRRHEALAQAYEQMGWRYHYIGAGVGDQDGDLTFYHMDLNKNNEWGFSTVKEKCAVKGLECRPEIVPVIRLASWIDEHIHQRKLPEVVHGSLKEGGPKVVMKMDIEFAEFIVLPDLVVQGSLCNAVDSIFGEFHFRPILFPLTFADSNRNITFKDTQDAKVYTNSLIRAMHSNPNCKTIFTYGDDESYKSDGIPWPTPPTKHVLP